MNLFVSEICRYQHVCPGLISFKNTTDSPQLISSWSLLDTSRCKEPYPRSFTKCSQEKVNEVKHFVSLSIYTPVIFQLICNFLLLRASLCIAPGPHVEAPQLALLAGLDICTLGG